MTATDIVCPRLLWLKFVLFQMIGGLAVTIALVLFPSLKLAALIGIAMWAFCGAYYFAFYAIEHYMDDGYHFAGLWSFVCYAMGRRRRTD